MLAVMKPIESSDKKSEELEIMLVQGLSEKNEGL